MRLRFSWCVPGVLAGGPHPDRMGGVAAFIDELRAQRIGAILTVYQEPLDRAELARLGLRYLWQPTPNFTAPPDLPAACRFIDDARADGLATLVHCWAGWGRTGTVLAAYLLHCGTAHTALDSVMQVRARYDPNAIESPDQIAALRAFALK